MNCLLLSIILVANQTPYTLLYYIMLKLRLKRIGRKRAPSYRLVVMENNSRRDGRPVEEVGYYDPISKKYNFETDKIQKWLTYGAKPTETVFHLLKKADIIK